MIVTITGHNRSEPSGMVLYDFQGVSGVGNLNTVSFRLALLTCESLCLELLYRII